MSKPIRLILSIALGLALFGVEPVFAQEDEGGELENLFSDEPAQPQPAPEVAPAKKQSDNLKDVSDLGKLSPFSDIAVIQKRYLPKTGRFELYGAGTALINDPFFLNFGLNGRLGYYFRERYGIEFVAMALTTTERQVTKDLLEKRGVTTSTIITPKSYYGLDFKWVPIYGKQTWLNKSIVPFDLYFSGGLGLTTTNRGTSQSTLHLGTGQTFAMSKGMAFRWDFSWNMFQAQASSGSTANSFYNNLFLNFGLSFFFPEATYR